MPKPSSSWWRTLGYTLLLVSLAFSYTCSALQVEGIWNPSVSKLKVIARFAVGKSNAIHREETDGYVFGNLTTLSHLTNQSEKSHNAQAAETPYHSAIMLYVNRTLFRQIYNLHETGEIPSLVTKSTGGRKLMPSFCEKVYSLVANQYYDPKCSQAANYSSADFVRYVPCPPGRPCNDPSLVDRLPDYQFTYAVDNPNPTFWFLILISCQRQILPNVHANGTNGSLPACTWLPSANTKSVIAYDVWLVNGHPSSTASKLIDLDFQFSLEQLNPIVYIILDFVYLVLLFLQLYALTNQKPIRSLNYLFTISLALQCLSYFFICCHKIVFAHNGKGFETLSTIADVMKIMSTSLFMVFVLMIAKGWPVSKAEIFTKSWLVAIWAGYTLIKVFLYVCVKNSLNFIEEVDEYHTVPGWVSLNFRLVLMLWFLYELRHTMILEQDPRKLRFYLHFGAGMLVWFVHLPLVAMVAMQIDLMWRYKIISGFSAAADVFAYAIVTQLMLKRRENHFVTYESQDIDDELEYYDEQSVNSETVKFSKAANYRAGKHLYDNDLGSDT